MNAGRSEGNEPALARVGVPVGEHPARAQARGGRARAAVAVPEKAHPQGADRGHLAPHPGPHQGRAALDPARALPRRVLHPAAHQGGRVLALGRRHRPAALLPALGRGHGARPARLRARLGADRRQRRRLRAHLLPARRAPGGAPLRARRDQPRHRHRLVRRGHQYALRSPARAHRSPQAHDLARHGELWAAPREPGRIEGLRLGLFHGEEDHRGRRAALPGEEAEAGGRLGRGGVRPLRHDRGGVRRRRRRRPPGPARLGRPVLSSRCWTSGPATRCPTARSARWSSRRSGTTP